MEVLEDRTGFSVSLNLVPHTISNSFAKVGFTNNVVAELSASVNGAPDKTAGDFHATID
jgi:hypothetical protein